MAMYIKIPVLANFHVLAFAVWNMLLKWQFFLTFTTHSHVKYVDIQISLKSIFHQLKCTLSPPPSVQSGDGVIPLSQFLPR